jgi:hypothetical protein
VEKISRELDVLGVERGNVRGTCRIIAYGTQNRSFVYCHIVCWFGVGTVNNICHDVDGLYFHGSGLLCTGFSVWKERSYFVSGNGSIGFCMYGIDSHGQTFVP